MIFYQTYMFIISFAKMLNHISFEQSTGLRMCSRRYMLKTGLMHAIRLIDTLSIEKKTDIHRINLLLSLVSYYFIVSPLDSRCSLFLYDETTDKPF